VLPRGSHPSSEQAVQAAKFSAYGAIDHVVDAGATSPEELARLIERALDAPPRARLPVDLDGARATCRIILDEVSRRRRGAGSGLSGLDIEPPHR
jgi:predicted glycosyltransferase